MGTAELNPKVDAYIAKAAPFAQPILNHLRKLVHKGCPEVEETIKWGRPFFEYRGAILGYMAGFSGHCSFGFWGREMEAVVGEAGAIQSEGMGTLGRIGRVEDLPSDKQLVEWFRQAAGFIDRGEYTSLMAARSRAVKPEKAALELPAEFATALKKDKQASAVFASFSASCKREYIEWIAEAKRAETRDKRIATAVEWIAEGKQRNWKYQNC